ncbi:DinB family protein [Granulicoccus phenolivorans]|uniref:DinB family protein n=1 Tax=Granulicoccus phenolivorans TaxID=266854 RepID=UPI0004249D27|nr:DinB family protein [Granulicoccus phenolivorans]
MTTLESTDLIEALDRHRNFLLFTAGDLTDEQARTTSTVSVLTIASLLKHVADTEEQWFAFADRGQEAFGGAGRAGANVEWEDTRFVLGPQDTLAHLIGRVREVGAASAEFLRGADLDATHPLPAAPWFEPGAAWSVRRVALHVLAEISQHAGHADIIREAIDGQHTM